MDRKVWCPLGRLKLQPLLLLRLPLCNGEGPSGDPAESAVDAARRSAVMNQQCTNNKGFSGELHQPNELSDAPGLPRRLSRVFARRKNTVSSLSLLRAGASCSRALPETDSEGVSSSRPSARFDLQLRQRNTGTPENLHPLYGKAAAAHLQRGGDPALYRRRTLPGDAERNRRLNEEASKSYRVSTEEFYECFDKLSTNGKTHMILTSLPFVPSINSGLALRLSKDERKVFNDER